MADENGGNASNDEITGITGNDVDEFLDTDEMNRKVMPSLEQFVNSGAQLVRYKSATQVAIGGASGWIVGCVFSKVGRIAASAVGGGLLLLQMANRCGYVSINWRKINRDIKRSKKHLPADVTELDPEVEGQISKLYLIAKNNAAISVGFIAGVLLGIST